MSNREYGKYGNGRSLDLVFDGMHANPGQFSLKSCDHIPGWSLTGDNLAYVAETPQPAGTNIFYEAVPFEMLRTYETEPQLIVTVDGQPVVCHNLTCDVTYIDPVGEITGSTFTESTRLVTITGTNLPTSLSDYQDINFA
jgi:hypothetical protein